MQPISLDPTVENTEITSMWGAALISMLIAAVSEFSASRVDHSVSAIDFLCGFFFSDFLLPLEGTLNQTRKGRFKGKFLGLACWQIYCARAAGICWSPC